MGSSLLQLDPSLAGVDPTPTFSPKERWNQYVQQGMDPARAMRNVQADLYNDYRRQGYQHTEAVGAVLQESMRPAAGTTGRPAPAAPAATAAPAQPAEEPNLLERTWNDAKGFVSGLVNAYREGETVAPNLAFPGASGLGNVVKTAVVDPLVDIRNRSLQYTEGEVAGQDPYKEVARIRSGMPVLPHGTVATAQNAPGGVVGRRQALKDNIAVAGTVAAPFLGPVGRAVAAPVAGAAFAPEGHEAQGAILGTVAHGVTEGLSLAKNVRGVGSSVAGDFAEGLQEGAQSMEAQVNPLHEADSDFSLPPGPQQKIVVPQPRFGKGHQTPAPLPERGARTGLTPRTPDEEATTRLQQAAAQAPAETPGQVVGVQSFGKGGKLVERAPLERAQAPAEVPTSTLTAPAEAPVIVNTELPTPNIPGSSLLAHAMPDDLEELRWGAINNLVRPVLESEGFHNAPVAPAQGMWLANGSADAQPSIAVHLPPGTPAEKVLRIQARLGHIFGQRGTFSMVPDAQGTGFGLSVHLPGEGLPGYDAAVKATQELAGETGLYSGATPTLDEEGNAAVHIGLNQGVTYDQARELVQRFHDRLAGNHNAQTQLYRVRVQETNEPHTRGLTDAGGYGARLSKADDLAAQQYRAAANDIIARTAAQRVAEEAKASGGVLPEAVGPAAVRDTDTGRIFFDRSNHSGASRVGEQRGNPLRYANREDGFIVYDADTHKGRFVDRWTAEAMLPYSADESQRTLGSLMNPSTPGALTSEDLRGMRPNGQTRGPDARGKYPWASGELDPETGFPKDQTPGAGAEPTQPKPQGLQGPFLQGPGGARTGAVDLGGIVQTMRDAYHEAFVGPWSAVRRAFGADAEGTFIRAANGTAYAKYLGREMPERVLRGLTKQQQEWFGQKLVADNLEAVAQNYHRLAQAAANAGDAQAAGAYRQHAADVQLNAQRHAQGLPQNLDGEPWFQAALQRHKLYVEEPLEKFATGAGVDPATMRRPATGYVGLEVDRNALTNPVSGLRGLGNRTLQAGAAKHATGLGTYTTDYRKIVQADALDKVPKSEKNQVFQLIVSKGTPWSKGTPVPDGQAVVAFTDRYDIVSPTAKNAVHRVMVPEDVKAAVDELAARLTPAPNTALRKVSRAARGGVAAVSLAVRPAAALTHMASLTDIVGSTPGEDALWKSLATDAVPVLGTTMNGVASIARIDFKDPKTLGLMDRLARIGALRPDEDGSAMMQTLQAKAPAVAATLSGLDPHRWLFGPRGVDVRSRLVVAQRALNLDPSISDADLRRVVVDKAGDYSAANAGKIVNALQGTGMSTFGRFVTTRIRQAGKSLVGATGMPVADRTTTTTIPGATGQTTITTTEGSLGRRLGLHAEGLARGVVGTAAGVAAANVLMSGHSPLSNEPGHKSEIDLGRKNDRGEEQYLDITRLKPIAMTAGRLGVKSLLLNDREEPESGRMASAARDLVNTGLSVLGPGPDLLAQATAGRRPYLDRDFAPIQVTPTLANRNNKLASNVEHALTHASGTLGLTLDTFGGGDPLKAPDQFNTPLSWLVPNMLHSGSSMGPDARDENTPALKVKGDVEQAMKETYLPAAKRARSPEELQRVVQSLRQDVGSLTAHGQAPSPDYLQDLEDRLQDAYDDREFAAEDRKDRASDYVDDFTAPPAPPRKVKARRSPSSSTGSTRP